MGLVTEWGGGGGGEGSAGSGGGGHRDHKVDQCPLLPT